MISTLLYTSGENKTCFFSKNAEPNHFHLHTGNETREGTKSGPLKGCWTACFSVLQLWPKFIEQLGRLTAKVKCKRCCNMNSSIFHPQHVNESKIVQKPGSYLWYWVARSVSWVSCQQYCQLAALCLLSLHGHCRHTCRFAGSKQEPFRGRWPRATQWFHGASVCLDHLAVGQAHPWSGRRKA